MSKSHGVAGAVQSGDVLGTVATQPYANGNFQVGAAVTFLVAAAPSGSNVPTSVLLKTTDAAGDANDFLEFDLNSHLGIGSPGVPGISACGTSPSVGRGSDVGGEVTEGTTATGCVITFKTAYVTAPFCTVSAQAALVNFAYSISTTAITVAHDSADSKKLNWTCVGV
jgi:hypothetical protein